MLLQRARCDRAPGYFTSPRRLRDERYAVVRPPSYGGGWKRHVAVG